MGSGKTTTAQLLAPRFRLACLLEETERHPFLARFYEDPERFALETELAFPLLRYHQLHQRQSGMGLVADFSPGKDHVFAKMNLAGEDLGAFERLYEFLLMRVSIPDLVVFLDVPVDVAKARTVNRGRDYERNVPVEYLSRLRTQYIEQMDELGKRVTVLELSGSESRHQVAELVSERVHDADLV